VGGGEGGGGGGEGSSHVRSDQTSETLRSLHTPPFCVSKLASMARLLQLLSAAFSLNIDSKLAADPTSQDSRC
jgi:hypothetical protein